MPPRSPGTALQAALARFPIVSPIRAIVAALADTNPDVRSQAFDQIRQLGAVSEEEALAVLNAAVSVTFPPQRAEWYDSAHDLIFVLLNSPCRTLILPARAAYGSVPDRCKRAILALLGATRCRAGAEAFAECIASHGWPEKLYERVFRELDHLLPFADALFPALLVERGKLVLTAVAPFLTAVQAGFVDEPTRASVAPLVLARLAEELPVAERMQQVDGVSWRFDEGYHSTRYQAGLLLDLIGWLPSPAATALLQRGTNLADPRLKAFAAGALVRQRVQVPEGVLDAVAASHESRGVLFSLLDSQGRADMFPTRWRTWAAFAAANMVEWLIYPTELGREPDALEHMATFDGTGPDGEVSLYVWRFRFDDRWVAGVSGPYQLVGEPKPLHGSSTFSAFRDWDEVPPEEHAADTLDILANWRRHHEG